ncbi:MAG: M28 family peptidase [Candidatus Zhuqueibacterota bacterium]
MNFNHVSIRGLLFFAMASVALSGELDKNLQKGFDSIQPMDPYNYCKTLALPEFAGRLTGHEGYTAAATWAAEKFRQWGLKPISPSQGYLQAYPSPYTLIDTATMTLFHVKKEGESAAEIPLTAGADFLPLLFSDNGYNRAALVFAGWGISAPELGYDDYAGIDVAGKFILCFRGTPGQDQNQFEKYDHHRHRMATAKERGALGIFYIYPEAIANPNGDWIKGFTPAMITEKIADVIFEEKNVTCADLKKVLTTYNRPLSFQLHSEMHFAVQSRHFPDATGYNIIGFVEGSDPQLKNECLVYGAHFDHCGLHLNMLFAGANDNASGSAVVMEIAEAFSQLDTKPKRSVAFVLFGGEEVGLIGSTYFVAHVPASFKKLDSMFNFDMVGPGDGTSCGFSANAVGFKEILQQADQFVHTLRSTWEINHVGVRSSDFAPFFWNGVQCASFYSNGPHLHYHKTGDTIYRINPDMLADISRLAFLSGFFWANR